jgi:hypothetical protein
VLLTDDEFAWLGAAGLTPDGSQMVISLSSGGGFDLFLYTVASPPVLVRQLTTSGESAEVFNANPDVSPDGTVVAFDRTFPGGDADLWSIGIDGTGSTALTVGEQDESHPSWSPDGDRIAFQRYDDDNWNIYVLTLDGSGGGAECQTDADCDADETCDSGQCVAPTSATQATLTHMSGFDFSTGTIPATGEDDDGSILAWAPFPSAAPAGGGSSTDLWFWARANTADENFTKDMGMVLLSSITAVPDTWDAGKDLPLDPLQVDHVYVVKCRDGYAKFLVKSLDPFGEDWSAEVDYVFTAGLTFDQ